MSYKKEQLSAVQMKYADSLRCFKPIMLKKQEDGVLLVQMIKDHEYTIKFAAAAKVLAEKNNLRIYFYNPNWTARIGWSKVRSKFSKYIIKSAPEKIYRAFGNSIIFDTEDKYPKQSFIQSKLQEIKKNIIKAEDILAIKFEDILVGDLIYDTYLRYFNQPTIEIINKDLFLIIEIGLNIFYNFIDVLEKNNVKTLLNLYTSYLDHGITARLCLDKHIRVYTVGSYSYIIQEASIDFPYHQINHTLFSPNKKLTEEQLNLAKEKLTFRFTGRNDEATGYMRQSAFSKTPISTELKNRFTEGKRNLVIYAHEFYDSPHINRMLQFPDLYQFLKQTLVELTNLKDTNVFIKIHPNGMPGTKEKTIELVNSFGSTHFHILDEAVSNHHIIELKPDLIATARGTVCVEMAYFEIPTVALYDNLYTNFDFVHTCIDTQSYYAVLRGEEKLVLNFDKKNIYSFYYQAFLEKVIIDEDNIMKLLTAYRGNTSSDEYLEFIIANGYLEKRKDLSFYYAHVLDCRKDN